MSKKNLLPAQFLMKQIYLLVNLTKIDFEGE